MLKQKLMMASILNFPNFSKEFIIKTDASTVGLGAVLLKSIKWKRGRLIYR